MKFLKNTLSIVALLTIGLASAKGLKTTSSATPTRPQTGQPTGHVQPRPQIQPQQQPTKVKNFGQLIQEVKRARNAWDAKTQLLNQSFVDNLVTEAIEGDLSQNNLNVLLKMARDFHAQFTGPKKDADILRDLAAQRENALDEFQAATL